MGGRLFKTKTSLLETALTCISWISTLQFWTSYSWSIDSVRRSKIWIGILDLCSWSKIGRLSESTSDSRSLCGCLDETLSFFNFFVVHCCWCFALLWIKFKILNSDFWCSWLRLSLLEIKSSFFIFSSIDISFPVLIEAFIPILFISLSG